uniref:DNA-directed DNA polymerase n=2 Tax=Meloidogyne TaxID=189290 RepID=A0A914KZX1_MELIC
MDQTVEASRNQSIDPDRLGALISSQLLDNDIWIPIRKLENDTIDNILNRFQLVSQSKIEKGSILGQPFTVKIQTLGISSLPKNQSIRGRAPQDNGTDHGQLKSELLIKISNPNNLCLFYALEITRKYVVKELEHRRNFSRYMQYNDRQLKDVFELLKAAKIPHDLSEYDAVEYVPVVVDFWNNKYKDAGYKFKVFVFGRDNEKPIFKYGNDNFNVQVSILHINNHFDGIRNVGGMFGLGMKYCFTCEKKFRKSKEHDFKCRSRCNLCGRVGSEYPCVAAENFYKKCDDCGKKYLNEDCFNHHKKSSNCRQTKICEKCGVIWSMKNYKREGEKKHVCGQKWCQICRQFHSMDRGCFIRPLELRKPVDYRLVTFDFEATQNEKINSGDEERRLHNVNFIAATVTCTKCMENDQLWRSPLRQNGNSCTICGNNRSITFSHRPFTKTKVDKQIVTENPLKFFIQWILFELNPQYTTMAFSHNGGRYDMVMAFREIYLNGVVPSMIRRGNKLYELKIPRNNKCNEVIFRDSFNLCPVALGKLIGAFGLQVTEKQFFPHLANISENYDITLQQLPPKSDYLYEGMSPAKQNEFIKWYEEEKNNQFCLDEALAEYCTNDVQILTEALIAFRKKFTEISKRKNTPPGGSAEGIDILKDAMTIASACMKHFRLNHLQPEHLAIVPEKGYENCDNQSELALKYLQWYEETKGVEIQYAHSEGGEHVVAGKYKVDGYIQAEDRAIEVNGCVWHACKKCFGNELDKILPNGKSVGETREDDEKRLEIIKKYIKNVDIIWECEIHQMLRRNKKMRKSFANYHNKGPINIRDCYFGGRTGPLQMYFDAEKEQHKITYLDFNSLYPSTIATTSFPVGHPKVHVVPLAEQKVYWTRYEQIPFKGILKVFLLPPPQLDVPVMPVKFDERLLFPLCRKCSLTYPNGANIKDYRCPHNDEERGWVSTCTSIELEEALKVGYTVTRFYRALHYEKWDENLFKNYVAEFMSMKIHASGFPEGIEGKESEDKFIKECKEKFGIELQREKMVPDQAMRYISKLMLNSLWGRFSLRNTLSKSVIINSPNELLEFDSNKSIEVQSVDELTEETILLTYKPREEFIIEHDTSNIVISLWTTSAARIRLLKAMQKVAGKLDCNLLYGDTDSILFSHPKDKECPLQTGPHLGDLAREYAGSEIKEYVGGACKAYALRMENNKNAKISSVLKVRGITLTADVCKILHFDSFKESVLQYANGGNDNEEDEDVDRGTIMIENPNFIRRNVKDGMVYSTKMRKIFRPIIQKGIISNLKIVHFGQK